LLFEYISTKVEGVKVPIPIFAIDETTKAEVEDEFEI
jgi:hypothetical protein